MNDFQRGYICACVGMLKHGQYSMIEEALRALGKVSWREIEGYDRGVLEVNGYRAIVSK